MVAAASLSALTTPALSVLLGSVVEQAQRLACPVGDGLILGSVVDRYCSSAHIHQRLDPRGVVVLGVQRHLIEELLHGGSLSTLGVLTHGFRLSSRATTECSSFLGERRPFVQSCGQRYSKDWRPGPTS